MLRLLLLGCLLGVANAQTVFLPDPMHFAVQLLDGAVWYWRTNGGSFPVGTDKIRLTSIDVATQTYPVPQACNIPEAIPSSGINEMMGAGTTEISTSRIQVPPNNYEALGFTQGKYRVCFCVSSAIFPTACNKTEPTHWNEGLGFLHVISSVGNVGVTRFQWFSDPAIVHSPIIIYEESISRKVQWLFEGSTQVVESSDRFMLIYAQNSQTAGAPWGFNCGQTKVDGTGADITALTGLGDNALVTVSAPGDLQLCTNNNTGNPGNSEARYCRPNVQLVQTSQDVTMPSLGSASVVEMFLCYCDRSAETGCTQREQFGGALGPVYIRSFTVTDHSKHYTVSADNGQQVTIDAAAGKSFNLGTDKVGLVRLNDPKITDVNPNYNWDYGLFPELRDCGISNLDPLVYQAAATTPTPYTENLPGSGTATEVVLTFDFVSRGPMKFAMCMCSSEHLNVAPYLTSVCPNPEAHPPNRALTGVNTNDNGWGNMLHSLYAQRLGYLHVVNTLYFPVNILVRAGSQTYFSIDFRSSTNDVSMYNDDDTIYEHQWLGRRFYFTKGTCGDAATSAISNMVGANTIFTRLSDSGAINSRIREADNSVSVTPRWGAVWSATTGWPADIMLQPSSGVTVQLSQRATGSASFVSQNAADLGDYNICLCDPFVEPTNNNTESCFQAFNQDATRKQKFGANIGTLRIAKAVAQQPAIQSNVHYTVARGSAANQITIAVPPASTANFGSANLNQDAISFIPFYGDRSGFSALKEIPINNGLVNNSKPINDSPWKLEYFCGRAPPATIHHFLANGELQVPDAVRITQGTAASPVTATFPTIEQSMTHRKFKVCYCSAQAWNGVSCPITESQLADLGNNIQGWSNMYRYNEFVGFMHVVDVVSLPQSSLIQRDVAGETYSVYFNSFDTRDRVFLIDRLSQQGCGTAIKAFGVTPPENGANLTQVGNTTEFVSDALLITTSSGQLGICYCSFEAEALAYSTPPRTMCVSENINSDEFGVDLGDLTAGFFVAQDQHFTVPSVNNDAFVISFAAAPFVSSVTTIAQGNTAAESDNLGFLSPGGVCGQDTIDSPLAPVADFSVAREISTAPYNFGVAPFEAHKEFVVCYCHRSLVDENCNGNNTYQWYGIGVLHVMDTNVYPQNFALQKNVFDWVTVQFASVTSYLTTDRFIIRFGTPCGTTTAGDVIVDSGAPQADSSHPEWLVAGSFKRDSLSEITDIGYLCMCDSREPLGTVADRCNTTLANHGNFGITVGTVYYDKFITDSDFGEPADVQYTTPPLLKEHHTVKNIASQTITIRKGTDLVSTTNPDSVRDRVGLVNIYNNNERQYCGLTSIVANVPDTPFTLVTTSDTAAFTLDFNNPAFTPIGKYQLCYCRGQPFGGICDETEAFQFSELAGFVHVVDVLTLPAVFISQQDELSTIEVTFATQPSSSNRFAFVSTSDGCGAAFNVSFYEIGTYSESITVSPYLSDKPVQTLAANVLTSSQFTVNGQAEFKICMCDANVERDTSSCRSTTGGAATRAEYSHYGVELGTIITTKFLTGADNGQRFTVSSADAEASFVINQLEPSATVTLDNDRVALIPLDGSCGVTAIDPSLTVPITSTINATDNLVKYQSDFGTPTRHTGLVTAPRSYPTSGQYRVCVCATSAIIGNVPNCDFNIPLHFADEAGILTVTDTPRTDQRVAVYLNEQDEFSITFLAQANVQDVDRFQIIEEDRMCGNSPTANVVPVSNPTDVYTLVETGTYKTLSPPTKVQFNPGVYKLCYCNAALNGLDSCPAAQISTQGYFSAMVGYLIVNDVRLNPRLGVWSTSVPTGGPSDVYVQYRTTSNILSSGGAAWFQQVVDPFTPCSDVPQGASTFSSDNKTITSSAQDTYTFDFTTAAASLHLWRLCFKPTGAYAVRDIVNVGVYVTDLTLSPSSVRRATDQQLKFEYTNSISLGSTVWFRRTDAPCLDFSGTPPTAAGPDNSNSISAPLSGEFGVFSFAQLSSISQLQYRLCMVDASGYLFDYGGTAVIVTSVLSVEPNSVPPGSQSIILTYGGELIPGNMIWFQRSMDTNGNIEQCVAGTNNATDYRTSEVAVAQSGAVLTLDFDIPSTELSQVLYQLCARDVSTGRVFSFNPIGVYIIDVSIVPTTVRPVSNQEVAIFYNLNGGASLVSGDQVVFTREDFCPSFPVASSSLLSSNSTTVGASGSALHFDFSSCQISQETYKMCVHASTTQETISYDSVGVQVVDVSISGDQKQIFNAINQQIELVYSAGSMTINAKVFFRRRDVPCSLVTDNVPSTTASTYAFVSPSPSKLVFDFSNVEASREPYRLCYSANDQRSALDYGGEDAIVWVWDEAGGVAPESVFASSNQEVTISWANNSAGGNLQVGDKVYFVRTDLECGSYAGDKITVTDVGGTTDFPTWTYPWNFTNVEISSLPFRICVDTDLVFSVIDYDQIHLYIIDVVVSPLSHQALTVSPIDLQFSAQSIVPNSQVWFVDSSCGNPPANAIAVTSPGEYQLDLSGVASSNTDQSQHFMCVRGDFDGTIETRRYSGVYIYIISVDVTPKAVTPSVAQLTLTVGGTSVQNNDVMYFSVESSCQNLTSTAVATTTHTDAIVFDGSPSYLFNFSAVDLTLLSNVPWRLCVVTPVAVLDYSDVQVSVTDLKIHPHVVHPEQLQAVVFDYTTALKAGDKVWFAAIGSPCTSSGTTDPPAQSATYTNVVDVTAEIVASANPVMHFDFSMANLGEYKLCILTTVIRVGVPTVIELVSTTVIISDVSLMPKAVLQLTAQPITLTFSGSFLDAASWVYFRDHRSDCYANDEIPSPQFTVSGTPVQGFPIAGGSVNTTEAVQIQTGVTEYNFTFNKVRQSTEPMRMCRIDTSSCSGTFPANTACTTVMDYDGVEVVVSDLHVDVSCVRKGTIVPVTITSTPALKSKDVLFFKKASLSCQYGGTPSHTISSTNSSNSQQVPAGGSPYSFHFNFQTTDNSAELYRLCVDLGGNGELYQDYANRGIRVSDTQVTNVNGVSGSSVFPLAGQTVTIFAGLGITAGDQFLFKAADVVGLSCECAFTVNPLPEIGCNLVPEQNQYTVAQPFVDGSNEYTIDMTPIPASTPDRKANMCVKTAAGDIFELSCVSLDYAVHISPESIPANDGQLVNFQFAGNLKAGYEVLFAWYDADCPNGGPNYQPGQAGLPNFEQAHFVSPRFYSSRAVITASNQPVAIDLNGFITPTNGVRLCVNVTDRNTGLGEIVTLPTTVSITTKVIVSGDPHIRDANGEWVDFYGEAGVYELYKGDHFEANAKFSLAVRSNFMIWHPKVMRAGTLIEEVGVRLPKSGVMLRLGVYGEGVVSVREPHAPASFWTEEDRVSKFGDVEVSWVRCLKACQVDMPWGTHERSRTLRLKTQDNTLSLHISESGGYRFIDVDMGAQADVDSTGLLADAISHPSQLQHALKSGAEETYLIASSSLATVA